WVVKWLKRPPQGLLSAPHHLTTQPPAKPDQEEAMNRLSAVVGLLLVLPAGGRAQPIQKLAGPRAAVFAVALDPHSRSLASAGFDHTIKLWQPWSGKLLRTLTGHQDRVLSLAYTPDGRHLASAAADGTIFLWDLGMSTEDRQSSSTEGRQAGGGPCLLEG